MKIYSKECEVNNNDYFMAGKVETISFRLDPRDMFYINYMILIKK